VTHDLKITSNRTILVVEKRHIKRLVACGNNKLLWYPSCGPTIKMQIKSCVRRHKIIVVISQ